MKQILLAFGLLTMINSCSQTNKSDIGANANESEKYFAEAIDSTWTEKLNLSESELRDKLSDFQYYVTQEAGTERSFTHDYNNNKKEGIYHCVVCGNPLYHSKTKFNSGTGWPSFFNTYSSKSVDVKRDISHGMIRDEVVCARCDSHLGHVFNDGPKPTGLRYCMNGESLHFFEDENAESNKKLSVAVFAQGCFWCLEEIFEALNGVESVVSGYSGGDSDNPTYQKVGSGRTNHAEAIEVTYNPEIISFEDLLKVYFNSGDVTQVNGQGPDHGPQYRSIIFYSTDSEKMAVEKAIEQAKKTGEFGLPLAIEVQKFNAFYEAEDYHQDFVKRNPNQGYVRAVSKPRYQKAIKNFPELLKKDSE